MDHLQSSDFERFTHTSRRVMIFANSEAHRLRSGIIGDAEFLLGLIAQGSSAGLRLLGLLGADIPTLSAKLEQLPRECAINRPPSKLPQTQEVKLIIQGAIELKRERSSDRVGTLHMTAAMLKHPEFSSTQCVKESKGVIEEFQRLLEEAGDEV